MSTELDTMIGYLAGREGDGSARLRAELGDPASDASRFLESARLKTRALLACPPTDGPPRPLPPPPRPKARKVPKAAAVAALLVVAAAIPFWIGQERERDLRAALDRTLADAKSRDARIEAFLVGRPASAAIPARKAGDEPIMLALNKVEEELGRLDRRLDGISRPAASPPPTAEATSPGMPDPSLAEIRSEIAAIRRETASSEQATARQLQEMRTVLHELNQIVRRAVSRPGGGGQQGPMPMMMPNNEFGPNHPGVDPAHVQALVNNLSSPHPNIRLEAAEQLSRLGPSARPAVQNLRQMLHQESDARVRTAAQAALSRISPE